MTDEIQTQQQPSAPKEEKKKNGSNSGSRGGRRTVSQSKNGSANAIAGAAGQRPSSTSSNRSNNRRGKASNTPTNDPASDGSRQANDSKGSEPRSKNQGGRNGGRGGQKKSQQAPTHEARQNNNGSQAVSQPTPVAASDASDALSSLQRVITDLKAIAPPNNSTSLTNNGSLTSSISMPNNNAHLSSNLPPNAPVFQPGAAAYPGLNPPEPPRHRKAASLGPHSSSPFMNNRNAFAPEFGPTVEDREDGPNMSFEEGEIRDFTFNQPMHQQTHQPRSQSQSFTAPRFAALAQQEQAESIGPTGRPQLAPGFMFGARRRPSASAPIGFVSPIGEEESEFQEFQFPQQQQQQQQQQHHHQLSFPSDPTPVSEHKRTPSSGGEIHGIMAEQVCWTYFSCVCH